MRKFIKSLELQEGRSDSARQDILRLEEDTKELLAELGTLRRDLNTKQPIDGFSNFKQTVERFYATKEHIRDVNSQLKGFSSLKQSETLENRLNSLMNRINDDFYPKYEITKLFEEADKQLCDKVTYS